LQKIASAKIECLVAVSKLVNRNYALIDIELQAEQGGSEVDSQANLLPQHHVLIQETSDNEVDMQRISEIDSPTSSACDAGDVDVPMEQFVRDRQDASESQNAQYFLNLLDGDTILRNFKDKVLASGLTIADVDSSDLKELIEFVQNYLLFPKLSATKCAMALKNLVRTIPQDSGRKQS
jgi:hypothetical protein